MGNKKRSKQSKSSGNSSSHTKMATEEPNEEESAVQTKRTDEERRKGIEIVERFLQEKQNKRGRDDDCTLVSSYWNSMSIDWKNEFLIVRVSDFKSHFSKDTSLIDFLAEALSYAEVNKRWKVWFCCNCSKEFSVSELLRQHVVQEHVGNLLPEMQGFVPQKVDNDWIEMIRYCSWKPLDAVAAVKMLEDQAKRKEGGKVEWPEAYSLADGWPVSDDSERAKLLERIHEGFDMLIRHKYLASSHLNRVIQSTKDEIQGLAAGSRLLHQHLDQSPTCICFLEAPQLKKIVEVLLEIFQACSLVMNEDKSTSPLDDLDNANDMPEIEVRIDLSEDASCLLLDECLVPPEITHDATYSDAMDDAVLQNTDPFLSWILSGSPNQLTLEEYRHLGWKLVETLTKAFDMLQKLSEKKPDLMNCAEAVQVVEDLCLEGKKRENFIESVLRKRKEELIEIEKDGMSVGSRYELDAITQVLQAADEKNVNQSGCASDVESQMDSQIETAIHELKENLSKELSIMDAEILEIVAKMEHMELKLPHFSAFDYRAILLPLVKMYLRACLEDLAVTDAKKKSDAAAEALLTELALEDSKKDDVKAESDKKSKDKKRKKGKSKTQNLKGTSGQEQHIGETHDDDSEQVEFEEDNRKLEETLELPQEPEDMLVFDDDDSEQMDQEEEEEEIRQCKIISLDEEIPKVQEEARKHEEEVRKHEEEIRKHEEEVRKHEEEIRKHEEEVRKHKEEITKHEEEVRKLKEEARKHEEVASKLKEEVREMLESKKQLENEDKSSSIPGSDDDEDHNDSIPVCRISEEEQVRVPKVELDEYEGKLDEKLKLQRKLEKGLVDDDDDDDDLEQFDLVEEKLRQQQIMQLELEIPRVKEEIRILEEEAADLKETVRKMLELKTELENASRLKQIAWQKKLSKDLGLQ